MSNKILDSVNNYYTQKVREHGASPRGVDWNSAQSQELRFLQLCRGIDASGNFSVLDFGCGYGAMLDYMNNACNNWSYTGLDISEAMIAQAKKQHPENNNAVWKTSLDEGDLFDYTIASGIFNVKLEASDADWKQYVVETLTTINKHSIKGFSFNMLTSYSDKEYMRDYLYYADSAFFFDLCKKNFSKYVALLHDYELYEFTIVVKK